MPRSFLVKKKKNDDASEQECSGDRRLPMRSLSEQQNENKRQQTKEIEVNAVECVEGEENEIGDEMEVEDKEKMIDNIEGDAKSDEVEGCTKSDEIKKGAKTKEFDGCTNSKDVEACMETNKSNKGSPEESPAIKMTVSEQNTVKSKTPACKAKGKNSKTVKKTFQCVVCEKVFNAQYTLSRHVPVHTGERKFICNVCGKAFRQASTLCRHKVIHTDERQHECTVCKKSFNRSSTLIAHMKTHNNVKMFECDVCGKCFHQKGNLKNHTYTHTDAKPYKCPHCERRFNQLSNLSFHLQQAHGDAKPLSCHVCQEKFQRKYELRKHEIDIHGIDYPQSEPPRYMRRISMYKNTTQSAPEMTTNSPQENDDGKRQEISENDFLNNDYILSNEANNNNRHTNESQQHQEDSSDANKSDDMKLVIPQELVSFQKTTLITFKLDKDNFQVISQQNEKQEENGEIESEKD